MSDATGRSQHAQTAPLARLDIRAPVIMGVMVIVVFFGFGIGSAAFAPIDKGVGLPGTIIVESKVKQVAHPRGGVVGKIHVSEGQTVKAGELLVSLDTASQDEQISALKAQADAAGKQLRLVQQESVTVNDLQSRQLAAKSKALALERAVAEVEKEVASVNARLATAEFDRRQSEIRSPVAGRVLQIQVHAEGAVVQPGGTIAAIVPDDDRLVIEGRLQPNQIENVKPGMSAKVWLTALSWRDQRPLAARLAWVSADSVEDKRTGAAHFLARIELDEAGAEIAKRMALHPGMRAEILLMTGQRTLLDQIIDPLMRNIHRAFHG
jgi:multidrug efflux pump subunit AcrA (membrane-fusion protein)